ncbi:hypothetical protein TNCV_3885931 [Trichonephila clavipes]|nr:hypothetical protein TNCV_3885931 [Trichonephila clavipes]
MAAVDFLYHENPSAWAGVEPVTLGTEGQRQTNHAIFPTYQIKQPALQAMTKTRALLALISSERVLRTHVFYKSGESTSKSSYAGGGLSCPGRKFTPTDT